MSFGDVLEAVDQLSLDDQATLLEVLNRRVIEQRRDHLALEIQQVRREFAAGEAKPATPDEIIQAIFS